MSQSLILTHALLCRSSFRNEFDILHTSGLSDLVVNRANICARISPRDVDDEVSNLTIESGGVDWAKSITIINIDVQHRTYCTTPALFHRRRCHHQVHTHR